ncbi:MAG: hypothetical protein ACYCVB_13675 [Bacilli bacterium]
MAQAKRPSNPSPAFHPAVDVSWILPNRLPVDAMQNQLWPLYNTRLAMNQFPAAWHGVDAFKVWKIPPRWSPYALKNEKPARLHGIDPVTLYITLQGTVFLYPQTLSGTQWPGPNGTPADIPPATVVAEFVPLKAAVRAGIIPESGGQPWLGGPIPHVWTKSTGMTAAQIIRAEH